MKEETLLIQAYKKAVSESEKRHQIGYSTNFAWVCANELQFRIRQTGFLILNKEYCIECNEVHFKITSAQFKILLQITKEKADSILLSHIKNYVA